MNPDTVGEAVEAAWQATLPGVPFDVDASWSDIGLDSLKALEMVFWLERRLGTRIGFDALSAQSTAADLIRFLSEESDGPGSAKEARPQVLLVPGLFGDEPSLAMLRRTLDREVDFRTLDLPDIETPVRVLASIRQTATRLLDQVAALTPEGPVLLAGFSFGGLVAQELACQLEQRGRRVAFLCVLDGLLNPFKAWRSLGPHHVPSDAPAAVKIRDPQRMVFALLFRCYLHEAARRVLVRAGPDHDYAWTDRRRRWLLQRIRNWAVVRWRPDPCRVPTLLITSTDFALGSSLARWREICPDLQTVAVPARHHRLFEPEPMQTLQSAFLQALAAIVSDRGQVRDRSDHDIA